MKKPIKTLLLTSCVLILLGASVVLGRWAVRYANLKHAGALLKVDPSTNVVEAKVVCEILARTHKFDKAVIELKQIDNEVRWRGGAPAGIVIFVKDFGFSFDYLDVYLDQDKKITRVVKIRQIGLTLKPTPVQC
jgi:hypothetical protein